MFLRFKSCLPSVLSQVLLEVLSQVLFVLVSSQSMLLFRVKVCCNFEPCLSLSFESGGFL